MVRVDVQGIHRVRKTLASGKAVEYHYAWRGGPRFWRSDEKVPLAGPDYFAAYRSALETRSPSRGLFREVIIAFLESPEFRKLKERTQIDMRRSIYHPNGIDAKFGGGPVGIFNRPEIRTVTYAWRDQFKPRQADHMIAHLSRIISWAQDRGRVQQHYLKDMTKLYESNRADLIWNADEIEAVLAEAPPWVQRILIAATETGMRPGDLRRLTRGHVQKTPQGRRIVIRTGKRNRMVSIPVTRRMDELIDDTPAGQMLLLVNSQGGQFRNGDSLGIALRPYRRKAETKGLVRPELHLYDARGTAATRLFEADASLREIALTMGWSPQHAAKMIETYVHMNPSVSDDLLLKLARERV